MIFLCVTLNDYSSFSSHVDNIVSSSNSKLFLWQQLKKVEINSDGLKCFYQGCIHGFWSGRARRVRGGGRCSAFPLGGMGGLAHVIFKDQRQFF